MSDIVIIGAGPAGLSAAIYACRAGKSVTVLEATTYGGQIVNTPDIENYPGIMHISGFDFATNLYDQATSLGAEVLFEKALAIEDREGGKVVRTSSGAHPCKAVIIAIGAKNRTLDLEGESRLVGHGVSYCATCDGMFFKGKDVAVVGGGNTAVEDALYLSGLCRTIYVIHRRSQFRAAEREVANLKTKENVVLVLESTVTALRGAKSLSAVEVTDKVTGKKRELPVSALFVAIGQVPDGGAFANQVELDAKGYVVSGEDCLTRSEGVFVAGDCRTKTLRQLITAASDGAVVASAACAYIG